MFGRYLGKVSARKTPASTAASARATAYSASSQRSRSDAWWKMRFFYDPEHRRRGRSARRYAVYTSADRADGYAIYRQKEKWEDFPDGTVHVMEVMAATAEAHEALWRFLTRIDLYPNVQYWNLPVDDELPWRVTDPRRVRRRRLTEGTNFGTRCGTSPEHQEEEIRRSGIGMDVPC